MSLSRLISVLDSVGLATEPRAIADALWLARFLPAGPAVDDVMTGDPRSPHRTADTSDEGAPPHTPSQHDLPDETIAAASESTAYPLRLPSTHGQAARTDRPIRLPAVEALPGKLHLGRSLRFLRRRVPHPSRLVLDEQATAHQIAEEGTWNPVLRPDLDRLLDLTLVIDAEPSMQAWQPLITELRGVLKNLGAFRDVRTWWFRRSETGKAGLSTSPTGPLRSPNELADPTHRRITLVVSDCVGAHWHNGVAGGVLHLWSRTTSVAILQTLPEHHWRRTGLRPVIGKLSRHPGGTGNTHLRFAEDEYRPVQRSPDQVPIPILQIEPDWLGPWAKFVGSVTDASIDCAVTFASPQRVPPPAAPPHRPPPADLVRAFRATATPNAFQLATYLTAVPLNLSTMRLVQRIMLPGSRPSHLAEVLLSGMLRRRPGPDGVEQQYEFDPEARELLADYLPHSAARQLRSQLFVFFADHLGISVHEFQAALSLPTAAAAGSAAPIAYLPAALLERTGNRSLAQLFASDGPIVTGTGDSQGFVDAASEKLAQIWVDADEFLPAQRTHLTQDENVNNITEAVRLFRQALKLERTSLAQAGLMRALYVRYLAFSRETDLDEAITVGTDAVTTIDSASEQSTTDPTDYARLCKDLGACLLARRGRNDLDEAVRLLERALARSTDDSLSTACYKLLAQSLRARFAQRGALSDMDRAVAMYRQAAALARPAAPARLLADLADALWTRFGRGHHSPEDLDDAVRAQRDAVAAADGAERRQLSVGLGDLLRTRFDVTGTRADLDEAIQLYRQAIENAPSEQDHVQRLETFSRAVLTRFQHSGNAADLDEVIHLLERSVESFNRANPLFARLLSTLSDLFLTRFLHGDTRDDLNRAVQFSRQAVDAAPLREHANYLQQFGKATQVRFEKFGDRLDIEQAVAAYQRAADLAKQRGTADRASCLTALAEARRARAFPRHGEGPVSTFDLDTAIEELREAVELTPADSTDYPRRYLLLTRLRIIAGMESADAVDSCGQVIARFAERFGTQHPDTLRARLDLGAALLQGGHPEAAERALTEAIGFMTPVLGRNHPVTLATGVERARALMAQNRREEAIEELVDVTERQHEALGAHHSDTMTSQTILDQWRSR